MNDDQINALAREYAEEKADPISFKAYADPEFKKELHIRGCANDAKDVIKFLLRRFCLVEKSKVEEEYKSSTHYFENTDSSNPTQKQYFWGRMCAIKSLFPEIEKEI